MLRHANVGLEADEVTVLGASAVVHAIINGSPKLAMICFPRADPNDDDFALMFKKMVKGMLQAAGRGGADVAVR